jgi:hypothetical protein
MRRRARVRIGALGEQPKQHALQTPEHEVHQVEPALAQEMRKRCVPEQHHRPVLVAVHEIEAAAVMSPVAIGAAEFVIDAAISGETPCESIGLVRRCAPQAVRQTRQTLSPRILTVPKPLDGADRRTPHVGQAATAVCDVAREEPHVQRQQQQQQPSEQHERTRRAPTRDEARPRTQPRYEPKQNAEGGKSKWPSTPRKIARDDQQSGWGRDQQQLCNSA